MTRLRARRAFLPIAASLILAASQLSSVVAAGPRPPAPSLTVGPNVDVSRFADNEAETTVAVNPVHPNNVVVVSNFQIADALMEAVTFDGGATWTTRMIADGSDALGVACCDPNAAFDEFGNFFLVYLDMRAKKVQVAYSTDGGATLGFLATIDHSDQSNPEANGKKWGAGTDQPSLTAGPGGTWFVYKMFSSGGQLLQVRGLPVSGLGKFGALSRMQSVPGSKYGSFGDIAVGQNGQGRSKRSSSAVHPPEAPTNRYDARDDRCSNSEPHGPLGGARAPAGTPSRRADRVLLSNAGIRV